MSHIRQLCLLLICIVFSGPAFAGTGGQLFPPANANATTHQCEPATALVWQDDSIKCVSFLSLVCPTPNTMFTGFADGDFICTPCPIKTYKTATCPPINGYEYKGSINTEYSTSCVGVKTKTNEVNTCKCYGKTESSSDSCPAGQAGSITTTTFTNCSGHSSTSSSNNCYTPVETANITTTTTSTCNVGSSASGTLSGGVFIPCSSVTDQSTCKTYTCTSSGYQ